MLTKIELSIGLKQILTKEVEELIDQEPYSRIPKK